MLNLLKRESKLKICDFAYGMHRREKQFLTARGQELQLSGMAGCLPNRRIRL